MGSSSSQTETRLRVSGGPIAFALSALALMISAVFANGDEIHVLSGGGAQAVLRASIPVFEKATGHRVLLTFAHVSVIQQKLAAGEKAGLILLPVPLIAAAEKNLPLRSEGRVVLARVGIAVVVRKGTTPPDISTPDAVRNMLTDAKSIEIPPSYSPAGAHLARMIEQLGIAEGVWPKLVIKTAIDGGAQLVADGKVDVAMHLLSEVQSAKDVVVAGSLPPALQGYVVYGTAIPASNDRPDPALKLVNYLASPSTKGFWKAAGFELLDAHN